MNSMKPRRGTPPYGWKAQQGGGEWIPNPETYPVLVLINEMRQRGESMEAIAQHLNAQGIPTRYWQGKRWTKQQISRVCANTHYKAQPQSED